jgi:methionyl-tRNA formyltransferase
MKIIFFGTPKEVVPVLENLTKHYEVIAVVTTPDQKSGRKQLLTPSPVKVFAQEHKISVLQPNKLSESVAELKELNADLFIVAAYGKIIPNHILELPKFGALNIHPSMLPKYRGSTPIQSTLLNGDETSGITFMKMDAKMDHGPILHQIPFTLEKTDTFEWLMQTKFAQAANVLPHVIDEYVAEKLKSQPQDETQATYTKMVTKEDGFIDLDNPPEPEKLDRMIRAYYPWPTVWTKVQLQNDQTKILKFLPKDMFQLEGKNPVSRKDLFNGYPEIQEKLEKVIK